MLSTEIEQPGKIPPANLPFRPNPLTSQSSGETTLFPVEFNGRVLKPKKGGWKTNLEGMGRLFASDRLITQGDTLCFVRYLRDFPMKPLIDVWDDTRSSGFGEDKVYVVQTNTKVIERCLLMTTDPGDLVLDPTCGSGTTAYVAEQWGRRWITCDFSRVALALAKHRLLTAKFDFYRLRTLNAEDLDRNPNGTWIAEVNGQGKATGRKMTFQCETLPHITLKSIARNTSVDPIVSKYQALLDKWLARLNKEVRKVGSALKERFRSRNLSRNIASRAPIS